MLRLKSLAKVSIRQNATKQTMTYSKVQVETLTKALLENPFNPGKVIDRFSHGHPLMQEMRREYPDAKPVKEPTVFDKLSQQSYENLESLRARSNYEKELNLIEKERTYTYPIDTSKFTYFDEKLYEAEKNVDWKQHIDFVKNELSQFKGTGQLYYFLEAIGQGLAKNPYMSLEEKKDEIARYVQYFIYKKENIIMLQLISAEQFKAFDNSEYANRMQDRKSRKTDVHTPEGVNPRHLWRDQKFTPYNVQRPEFFWMTVEKAEDREKLKKAFGDKLRTHKDEKLVRISHFADDETLRIGSVNKTRNL